MSSSSVRESGLTATQQKQYLGVLIPYRLEALRLARLSVAVVESTDNGYCKCQFTGDTVLQGGAQFVTNALIETGVMHARVLLAFLGIKRTPAGVLALAKPTKDDVGIQSFNLSPVALDDVLSLKRKEYDAKTSILYVLENANKLLLHMTTHPGQDPDFAHHFRVVADLITLWCRDYLYKPLGLAMPDAALQSAPAKQAD